MLRSSPTPTVKQGREAFNEVEMEAKQMKNSATLKLLPPDALVKTGDVDHADGDVRLLRTESELGLIRKMLQLPELVETATLNLAPHLLPFYAQELATVFHRFYRDCRVVSEDAELTRARLKLVRACQIVLANSLELIGVSAPERM